MLDGVCVDLVLGAISAFPELATGGSRRTIPGFSTNHGPIQHKQLDRDVFRSLLGGCFKAKQISVDWDMVDNLEDTLPHRQSG